MTVPEDDIEDSESDLDHRQAKLKGKNIHTGRFKADGS
jgi:hypothetical protein